MTKVIYSPSPKDDHINKRPGRLECSDCPKEDNKHEAVTWFSTGEARCEFHLEKWKEKYRTQTRKPKGDTTVAKEKESKRVAIEDRAKEAGLSNAEVTKLVALYKKDPKAARKQLRRAENPSEAKSKKEAVEA
jgi:hypothetical protein